MCPCRQYLLQIVLEYADDTVFIGRNRSAVEEVLLPFEREAEKIGLKINEELNKIHDNSKKQTIA